MEAKKPIQRPQPVQQIPNSQIKTMMSPLSQEFLESLAKRRDAILPLEARAVPPLIVVYFTADWCGPCNKLNLQRIVGLRKDIHWMLCDVDQNDYSLGYCGGRSIPAWLAIVNGKPQQLLQMSSDEAVCKWLATLVA